MKRWSQGECKHQCFSENEGMNPKTTKWRSGVWIRDKAIQVLMASSEVILCCNTRKGRIHSNWTWNRREKQCELPNILDIRVRVQKDHMAEWNENPQWFIEDPKQTSMLFSENEDQVYELEINKVIKAMMTSFEAIRDHVRDITSESASAIDATHCSRPFTVVPASVR